MNKCKLCNSNIKKDEIFEINKTKYCLSCYELKKKEEDERQLLIRYITSIFNIDIPNGMMFAQMKNLKEKDNISYREQYMTLYYTVEVEKMRLEQKYGIGIIKYKYSNMLAYKKHIEQERKKEEELINKNKQINIDANVIKINPKHNKESYRDRNIIKPSDWGI